MPEFRGCCGPAQRLHHAPITPILPLLPIALLSPIPPIPPIALRIPGSKPLRALPPRVPLPQPGEDDRRDDEDMQQAADHPANHRRG